MDDALLALLRSVDTPTVCNAIEVAQGKRGFNNFTRGTMLCSDPTGVVVGYAVTAKIAAVNPPSEAPEVIRARRMAYYKAMAEAPKPSVRFNFWHHSQSGGLGACGSPRRGCRAERHREQTGRGDQENAGHRTSCSWASARTGLRFREVRSSMVRVRESANLIANTAGQFR